MKNITDYTIFKNDFKGGSLFWQSAVLQAEAQR